MTDDLPDEANVEMKKCCQVSWQGRHGEYCRTCGDRLPSNEAIEEKPEKWWHIPSLVLLGWVVWSGMGFLSDKFKWSLFDTCGPILFLMLVVPTLLCFCWFFIKLMSVVAPSKRIRDKCRSISRGE